jgi:hypothetical protein
LRIAGARDALLGGTEIATRRKAAFSSQAERLPAAQLPGKELTKNLAMMG